jgi:hypothetical protein
MSNYPAFIFFLFVATFSIALPVVVWFDRKRVFAVWARITSIIGCIAGLCWGFLGWVLANSTLDDYSRVEGIKGLFGGICIGLVLSIIIARPYVKRVA